MPQGMRAGGLEPDRAARSRELGAHSRCHSSHGRDRPGAQSPARARKTRSSRLAKYHEFGEPRRAGILAAAGAHIFSARRSDSPIRRRSKTRIHVHRIDRVLAQASLHQFRRRTWRLGIERRTGPSISLTKLSERGAVDDAALDRADDADDARAREERLPSDAAV